MSFWYSSWYFFYQINEIVSIKTEDFEIKLEDLAIDIFSESVVLSAKQIFTRCKAMDYLSR